MTDNWEMVEEAFARIDNYPAWRPIVAAMRRLVVMIRGDSRFHDVEPSVSHAYLVFRRHGKPIVLVGWNVDDRSYGVAFIEPGFEMRAYRRVKKSSVLDVLHEYLQQAAP